LRERYTLTCVSDPYNPQQPQQPGYFPDPTLNQQPTIMDPAAIPYQPGSPEGTTQYQPGTPQPGTPAPPPYTPGYTPPSPAYSPGNAQAPYQPGQPTYDPTAQQTYGQQPGYTPYQTPGAPGSPYSYSYQAPKKSRTGMIVGIIVAVVVVLVGACVGGAVLVAKSSDDKPNTPVVASGNSTTAAPTVDPKDVPKDHTGDLRTFLVKPPSSSHPLSKPMSKTGTMTLDDDVAQATDKTARRSFLEEYNFVIEAVVEWDQTDDTIVEMRLLRFDNADDAKGYFDEDKSDFEDDYGITHENDVDGVPEAVTFGDNKKDKYGYVSTAGIGVKGDVVIVTFTSQSPPLKTKVSDTLIQKQYAKL
jgi:hypothetical protein